MQITAGESRGVGRPSAGERLADDMAEVVREEVRSVRSDLADAARPAASGVLLFVAATGCAVLAVGAASTTLLRLAETLLPRRLAPAGLTVSYLMGAAVLGSIGARRLRRAGGSSQRLGDQIRQALTRSVGRPGRVGASVAREAASE